MGIIQLTFILLNFFTLGRLIKRVEHLHPGLINDLWNRSSFFDKADVILGFVIFWRRATMLDVAVVRPQELPVYLLGDDQVAALVTKLHQHWAASAYRGLNHTSHGPLA